ncbi:expressed unknown protein [Seminavis robusta]|uniref:Uncharacterized protein n=1 Tax=Seminavis robusta TaxID=568900 RepID=A0A9N8EAW5_9STRA|nr:expressed unknown protein [Seminavis robusta]|eukprot:Sro817_g206890.1 n/a (173) ;mRNA; f:39857-40375
MSSTSACWVDLREWVHSVAPQAIGGWWFVINLLVCIYSCLLLALDIICEEDTKGKIFVARYYLWYSLITTGIWLAEIGLEVYYSFEPSSWEQRIELTMAVVFTASSLDELLEWNLRDQNIYFMELDLLANAVVPLRKLQNLPTGTRKATKKGLRNSGRRAGTGTNGDLTSYS